MKKKNRIDGNCDQLLALLLEGVSEPFLLVGSGGQILGSNSAIRNLFGHSESELLAKPLAQFCRRHDGSVFSLTELCGQPGAERSGVWQFDGHRETPARFTVFTLPISPNSEPSYALHVAPASAKSFRDRHNIQLEKLGALGIFAGGIAHDLNNILTGILGHINYLRLSLAESGAHVESLSAIEDGARRASAMAQQILGFARREHRSTTVNLTLVVTAAVNLLRRALPDDVHVTVRCRSDDICVHGDEGQLSQLVMNLLVNARDALPRGGSIEIELDHVTIERTEAELQLAPGEYAHLGIRDNGTGIPPEIQERIFEPFFTTKADAGTGLGLATVFSIVQAHGGSIDVSSEVSVGTRFDVYFPWESENAEEADSDAPLGRERILVVDDEETVRTSIQRTLEHLGYLVDVAEDGNEALDRCAKAASPYSLIILDMMMPHMSGDEVFRKLRSIDSSAKVLLASGYSSDLRAKRVLENGGLGYIQKPFAVEELAREVRRCIDSSRSTSR